MTSDPKHLPPRDCQVWYQFSESNVWVEARYLEREKTWISGETFRTLDPSRVITWRELPEVE